MSFSWNCFNKFNLNYHTDTIELSQDGDLALCGSYELLEDVQQRVGHLSLFHSNNESNYTLSCQIECSGVLDISWLNSDDNDNTAVTALANGSGVLWKASSTNLTKLVEIKPSDSILLSTATSQNKIVFSDSSGKISLWTVDQLNLLKEQTWLGHEFEAWCATLDKWNNNIVYSGGDDNKFFTWDTRQGYDKPIHCIKHDMGVCSIQNVPQSSHTISTGCYDGNIRLWDLRMLSLKPSASIDNIHIGGGVWRHKWNSNRWLLVGAMHAGFIVLHYSPDSCVSMGDGAEKEEFIKLEDNLYKLKSTNHLAYGVDWLRLTPDTSGNLKFRVALCSFYDNEIEFGDLTITAD